jgi:hypothetical protein
MYDGARVGNPNGREFDQELYVLTAHDSTKILQQLLLLSSAVPDFFEQTHELLGSILSRPRCSMDPS